jgi:hypothetical protein
MFAHWLTCCQTTSSRASACLIGRTVAATAATDQTRVTTTTTTTMIVQAATASTITTRPTNHHVAIHGVASTRNSQAVITIPMAVELRAVTSNSKSHNSRDAELEVHLHMRSKLPSQRVTRGISSNALAPHQSLYPVLQPQLKFGLDSLQHVRSLVR